MLKNCGVSLWLIVTMIQSSVLCGEKQQTNNSNYNRNIKRYSGHMSKELIYTAI